MPSHKGLRSVLAFIVLLFAGVGALNANTYLVLKPPVPLWMHRGDRIVAVNTSVDESFAAQRIYLRLVVTGMPVAIQPVRGPQFINPGVEDCPAWLVPSPIPPVDARDLSAARRVLEDLGITNEDISTSLSNLPVGYCARESQGVAAVVGQILVRVQPATEARYDQVRQILSKATAQWSHFHPAGIIEARDSCDAQQNIRDLAISQAQKRAEMLSQAAGLGAPVRSRLDIAFGAYSPASYRAVCGNDAVPPPSPEAGSFSPAMLPYLLSVSGGAAFAARSNVSTGLNPSHALVLQTAGTLNFTQGVVPFAIHIPPDEPFVSAQGTFRALVRPDALLLDFSVPDIPMRTPPPGLMDKIVNAVRSAGVSPADIRRHRTYVSVRIRPVDQTRVSRVRLRVKAVEPALKDYPTGYGFTNFVQDCDAMRFAVAREAFLSGLKRARLLASSANLRLGDVIGVNDAGQDTDAICGYGSRSSMDELDGRAAISTPVNFDGPYAVFESSMVIAWRLEGGASTVASVVAPRFTIPYSSTNVNQSFVPPRAGVLGFSNVTLTPTRAFITVSDLQDSSQVRAFAKGAGVRTDREGNRLFELREAAPESILAVVKKLKSDGIAVQNVAFYAGDCERRSLEALKASVVNGLSLVGKQPIYALIDQLPVYYVDAGSGSSGADNSICGFAGVDGLRYVGGSYEGYGNAQYSLRQQVFVVPGLARLGRGSTSARPWRAAHHDTFIATPP